MIPYNCPVFLPHISNINKKWSISYYAHRKILISWLSMRPYSTIILVESNFLGIITRRGVDLNTFPEEWAILNERRLKYSYLTYFWARWRGRQYIQYEGEMEYLEDIYRRKPFYHTFWFVLKIQICCILHPFLLNMVF